MPVPYKVELGFYNGGRFNIYIFVKEYYVSNEKLCLKLMFVLIINNFAYSNHDRGMERIP